MSDKFSKKSCGILQQLYDVIEQRRQELPPDSYTTTLFKAGMSAITRKLREESRELVEAAETLMSSECQIYSNPEEKRNTKNQVTHEAADLMYHFLVLLAACELTPSDIEQELARRFGVSGLEEKAVRKKRSD